MVEGIAASAGLCLADRPPPGVVARARDVAAMPLDCVRSPQLPQDAIVVDAGGDVPLRIVDARHLRILRRDLVERVGHELHDPACADPALCSRVEVAFSHALCLEETPVEADAEVALGIFSELVVEPICVPPSDRRSRLSAFRSLVADHGSLLHQCPADRERCKYGKRSRARASAQFSAPATTIATDTKMAATKIPT